MTRVPGTGWICLFATIGCGDAATSALLTVDNEVGDELDSVRVEIRDSADTRTSETRVFSSAAWSGGRRFSFGVVRGEADSFIARATGFHAEDKLAEAEAQIRVNVVNPDAVLRGSKIWAGEWLN